MNLPPCDYRGRIFEASNQCGCKHLQYTGPKRKSTPVSFQTCMVCPIVNDENVQLEVPEYPSLAEISEGAGTELKKLLMRFGIHPTEGCQCDAMALKMNMEGVQWCRDNISEIITTMRDEAKKRGWPFIKVIGKRLVNVAIRKAEKNGELRLSQGSASG